MPEHKGALAACTPSSLIPPPRQMGKRAPGQGVDQPLSHLLLRLGVRLGLRLGVRLGLRLGLRAWEESAGYKACPSTRVPWLYAPRLV